MCLPLCVREHSVPSYGGVGVCLHLSMPVSLTPFVPMRSKIPCPHFLLPPCRFYPPHSCALCLAFVPELPGNGPFLVLNAHSCHSGWMVVCLHLTFPLSTQGPHWPPLPPETAHSPSVFPTSLATLPSPLGPSNVSGHTTQALAPVSCLFSSKFQSPGCKCQGNTSVSSTTDSHSFRTPTPRPPFILHLSGHICPGASDLMLDIQVRPLRDLLRGQEMA